MNTRITLEGERLVVATTGNRGSDFTVTLDPVDNGRSLRMTRTIDDEVLREPVTVRSFYRRLSDEARWNIDASARRGVYNNTSSPAGEFVVPDGTRLVARLDNALSTTSARDGDPYTMTARSPSQYEGAVIQGFVSSVNGSGRLSGRAGMTLNLRSIRLRNGVSYQFDGVIEDIHTPARIRRGFCDQRRSQGSWRVRSWPASACSRRLRQPAAIRRRPTPADARRVAAFPGNGTHRPFRVLAAVCRQRQEPVIGGSSRADGVASRDRV